MDSDATRALGAHENVWRPWAHTHTGAVEESSCAWGECSRRTQMQQLSEFQR